MMCMMLGFIAPYATSTIVLWNNNKPHYNSFSRRIDIAAYPAPHFPAPDSPNVCFIANADVIKQ